ncbi:M15 family metallopeptidase [Solihabitans fulvus]|uniref:M15 family metallopeptidase n=1 Tax=Solihabitans fulvus TaxID=1892852 RepID=A0A5B2XQS7_9PSEU|nr:M15 family metallopeptidase [Solihabitans fulvus]KAA2265231.1 M15 family metallopeptidase [Solihabitans fulvus]
MFRTRVEVPVAVAVGIVAVALSACTPQPVAGRASVIGVPTPGSASTSGTASAPETEDGSIPENSSISPNDSANAAIRKLDPDLLAAVRKAADAAKAAGVEVRVTSGWRSKEYQQRLLDQAVAKYRNREEALRFVSTPDKSAHVLGKAVDIGPTAAADWVGRHGSDYGLCQVYENEMWHFELLTSPGGQCPPQRADAAVPSQ